MRSIKEPASFFKTRREKVFAQMPEESVMVLYSPASVIRNGNVEFEFRQDSNLYFLSGWEEPDSLLILSKSSKTETILFVPPKDSTKEMWEGFRFGPEGAMNHFGVDRAFSSGDLDKELPKILQGKSEIYLKTLRHPVLVNQIFHHIDAALRAMGRVGLPFPTLKDPDMILSPLRRIKDSLAIQNQRIACEITSEAHRELMAYCRPGMNERELSSYFKFQIGKRGCAREGYKGIFAGGLNACTLHYTYNDQDIAAKDLVLIDAGGEYHFQTADITRTFPVSGKFSGPQKDLYSAVLQVQKDLISAVKVGVTFEELQEQTCRKLSQALVDLKILKASALEIFEKKAYHTFYPHRIGHYLGMDVHDVGAYKDWKGNLKPLDENCVITIEPGLYFPAQHPQVPEQFWGLGVRIEDDILVTAKGPEVLTEKCPKEIAELEAIIGSA